eukprot:9723967-Prorocentrum_lima.AAC.1
MTSSLVGSEMCIRDSVTASKMEFPEAFEYHWKMSTPEHVRPHGPDEKPVSYTHLTLPTICSV